MMKVPYMKEAFKNLFKPPVTEKYPFVKIQTPEHFRGKIKYNPDTCLGCGMCIRVCSPGAITKTVENVEGGQKITMHFNLGSCTFCQMCADFCPKKSIELTQEYSMVTTNKDDLFVEGSFIKKLPPRPPVKAVPPKNATETPQAAKETMPKTQIAKAPEANVSQKPSTEKAALKEQASKTSAAKVETPKPLN